MEEDDDFSDSWDEMEENNSAAVNCLFCNETFRNIDGAVSHCSKAHDFDLSKLKARFKMDCYSYIRLINYVRTKKSSPMDITNCVSEAPPWEDDVYMKPVVIDDPWLMFDFEDLDVPPAAGGNKSITVSGGFHVNAEDGCVTLSEVHFSELQKTIQNLTAQVKEKEALLHKAATDIEKMKSTLQKVVGSGQMELEYLQPREKRVSSIKLSDDQEYFNSYAHFGIHHEMLTDFVRTVSYRDALHNNKPLIQGKTVLDLGCGTGILSMFVASAGAATVIGIDHSDILYNAIDIVKENKLEDTIILVKGRLEDTELPIDKVDIIVSEWMGYFLLFEAMVDSVIYARDTHLKPGGMILPNRCTISIVGCSDEDYHKEYVGFWNDVYGYRMSCMCTPSIREPLISVVSSDHIVTTAAEIYSIDLNTVSTDCTDFKSEFSLTATKDTELTAIIGYFDVCFDLSNPVSFSTGPLCKPTHWKQTVFLIKKPIPLKQGEVLNGKLVCERSSVQLRSLKILLTIKGVTQEYFLH